MQYVVIVTTDYKMQMIRRSETMKEWRILLLLEFNWKMFRLHRKLVNWLVKKGMKLSSPVLCLINRKLDHYGVSLAKNGRTYERITGETIRYYKRDII